MPLKQSLRHLRLLLGKTQTEMAAVAGVSLSTWQNYERGVSEPGAEVLRRIHHAGVSLDRLFAGDATMRLVGEKAGFDEGLLTLVIETVESALAARQLVLPADKKARVISLIHAIVASQNPSARSLDRAFVERFLSLLS